MRSPKADGPAQSADALADMWSAHNAAWRHTAQISSQWQDAETTDPRLLKYKVKGKFFNIIDKLGITLIVGREYEHLIIGISMVAGEPEISFMPMPHPSGIAVDRQSNIVYVASTRNPNQIYDLMPVTDIVDRLDGNFDVPEDKPLLPVRSRFLPGCLYLHDLAMVGGLLHGNAVGHNAVVLIDNDGHYTHKWWPKCIEKKDGTLFGQNYIQLNSIAAGKDLKSSFFSASADVISSRRPGHKNFPVDKRGVIFSGKTREAIVYGLTRPHSARLYHWPGTDTVWVDNSGYGEFGFVDNIDLNRGGEGRFTPVVKLPGWTRGLSICQGIAFVGVSRVIPRFRQYAPGLDVDKSECGVVAVDIKSGNILGSIVWPYGNQIFALDWLPAKATGGFPMKVNGKSRDLRGLFYTFAAGSGPPPMNGKGKRR